jgi:hypothetical protein
MLRRQQPFPASIDLTVRQRKAAVIASGGTMSAAWALAESVFVRALKSCGAWERLDDAALLLAENQAQALVSLKLRLAMTTNGTFSPRAGIAHNGTSQFTDTKFVPSTMASKMTAGNIRLSISERTNVATNTTSIGAQGSVPTLTLRARNASSQFAATIQTNQGLVSSITDSRALLVASRTGGSTTCNAWQSGVALADMTGLTPSDASLVNRSLYIGARNAGSADQFRANTAEYAEYGAPLATTAQELAVFTAFAAFKVAVGA